MSEIVLIGGNGFVGRHVVTALLGRGDTVRVLALDREDTAWLEHRGVAVYRGDVRDPSSLVAPVAGADGVVHLAAMMDVWRPLRDYHAVNVAGTANVCRAALHAGVARLVHLSSSSVYGTVTKGARPLPESTPLRPFPDPYPMTKAWGDELVQRLARERGLPSVVLRPDQIFGPGDEMHFARMADRLRAGRCPIVGRGENAVPLVYITDLVAGVLLALDHPAAPGRAYNIGAATPITQRELLEQTARAIGAPPPRLRLPYGALYAAGWLAERAAPLLGRRGRPPITRFGVAFIGRDQRFSIQKAAEELGYSPAVELRDGVRLTAEWYLARPQRSLGAAKQVPAATTAHFEAPAR